MENHKITERDVSLVMDTLDQLVENFKILKLNFVQHTSTLTHNGWGSGDKNRELSFKYSTTEVTRKEVESRVRSYLMMRKLRWLFPSILKENSRW